MLKKQLIFIMFLVSMTSFAQAKVELFDFKSPEQQELYYKLSEQLRCLVCQNQNLAGSNAELAQDMRNKTYALVLEEKSEDDIIDYWVSRYGDFVLYNPPLKQETLILWIGPFVLLLIAVFIGFKIIRSSKNNKQESDKEVKVNHDEVKKLLD